MVIAKVTSFKNGVLEGLACSKNDKPVVLELYEQRKSIGVICADKFSQRALNRGLSPTGHCKFTVDLSGLSLVHLEVRIKKTGKKIHLYPFDNHLKYFFMHIPKTAGSSIRKIVSQNTSSKNIYPTVLELQKTQRGRYLSRARLIEYLNDNEIHYRKFIFGHYKHTIDSVFLHSRKQLTFIREPVARTLSHLNHLKHYKEHYSHLGLDEIYSLTRHAISNLQASYVGYDSTSNRISNYVKYIGTNVDKQLPQLLDDLSLSKNHVLKRHNVSLVPYRTDDTVLLEQIKQDNSLDCELWNYINSLPAEEYKSY